MRNLIVLFVTLTLISFVASAAPVPNESTVRPTRSRPTKETTWCTKPIDWQKSEQVQTGVQVVKLALDEPQLMKVAVMRIDLHTPGIRFAGTDRAAEWGQPMPDYTNRVCTIRTKRQRTGDFLKEQRAKGRHAIAAFNTTPWGPWCSPYTFRYGDPAGLNICEGRIISDHGRAKNPMLVAWKDGRVEIRETLTPADYPKVQLAHTGFDLILKNGISLVPMQQHPAVLHPRLAVGVSRDHRYLIVIAVDGRQKDWSLGATYADLVQLMTNAGAWDAVNMDGGGSTTLMYWDEKNQEPVMLNRHSIRNHNQRPNAVNVAVWLKK